MKNSLLNGLALMIGLTAIAQRPRVRNDIFIRNYQKEQAITVEPLKTNTVSSLKPSHPGLKNGGNANIVTVLDLGTSANVVGYSHGTRSMVWADDDLNVVVNFHRLGPGSTPPGLSGYLGMDLGLNLGMTQTDWTPQIMVHAATMAATPYYYDECRFPAAAIYNPAGNTNLANAFLAYFAPDYANLVVPGLGGYSYGTVNLADPADTTSHTRWYNAAPFTYIPDGFTISTTGIAHMVDLDMNVESGTPVYQDSVIYGRGVWNPATLDFDYTFHTLAFPCKNDVSAADCKIAVSPDGNTVWISVLTDYPGATPLIDSTYFPVLIKSTDGGLTWSEPMVVQLDGPNGLQGIKNQYSEYFILNLFGFPLPTRDEIPYTTAFDHSLSVDFWGNPHIGVAIGYAPGSYSIASGVDSLINVFDIYSIDDGYSFRGVCMGSLKTFRGTWETYTCDNRVYISRTQTGDIMFFTWNDTRIDGEPNNQKPDVWARGYNLNHCMLTSDNGLNAPNMVTNLSEITHEAYWQCTSPFVFTDNNKYTIPICTQWFSVPIVDATFKYIPDFSYSDSDFTIPIASWPPCGIGIDQKNNESDPVTVQPNPVKDIAQVSIDLVQNTNVIAEVFSFMGQQVMCVNKGPMNAGSQQFTIDVSGLSHGLYFITVRVDEAQYTRKMVVE